MFECRRKTLEEADCALSGGYGVGSGDFLNFGNCFLIVPRGVVYES